MNWLSDFVRPKIKKLPLRRLPTISGLSVLNAARCFSQRSLKKQFHLLFLRPSLRLPLNKRFEMLFDNGDYKLITLPKLQEDPLNFKDSKNILIV